MISDNIKAIVFYGFAGLWIIWGVVYYILDYGFEIYLIIVLLLLIGWIIVVIFRNMNVTVKPGWVRLINVKIP